MTALCSNCQKPLNANGACPTCLLRLALNQTEDSGYPVAGKGGLGAGLGGDLPSIEELKERLPQFDVQRLIGRGGMGGIYQARQRNLDRDVAIKLISPQILKDPAFLERFDREAKALAKLSHPGIVGIFDCGQTTDGLAYLVMEFVDGINLRQAMQLKQITAREAVELTIQICDALEYAHSRGVVHRDIKPENILLGEDGTIKVADFGIAKLTDPDVHTPTLTATRQVLGSLHYLAPEHIETPAAIDHRVDLYAVGVVLYELLTGHLPIGRYEPPSSVVPTLGRKIDDVVQQALSRRPQDRFESAAAMRSALVEVQSSEIIELELVSPGRVSSETNTVSKIAVPFICEALNGFAETLGVLYFEPEAVTAEFRTRDKFFHSSFSGKTKIVRIHRNQLVKLRLTPGVFNTGLTIIADSIATLGDLPNAEAGQVKLRIKNSDLKEAHAGLQLLGYNERTDSAVFQVDKADNPFTASEQHVYAILSFLCACLNYGYMAIAIVMMTKRMSGHELTAAILAVTITISAIAILQTITGACHWFGISRGLANANNILSVLPATPVWILSAPLAVWSWSRMMAEPTTNALNDSIPPSPPRSLAPVRGATTLMLLRESRWAKAITWLNAAGSLVIITALTIFLLGLYSVELRYRLLDTSGQASTHVEGNETAQSEAIRQRLRGIKATVVSLPGTELKIQCMQRESERVREALQIRGALQIGWLADSSEASSSQRLPTLLRESSQRITKDGLLPTMAVHGLQPLQSNWVTEFQDAGITGSEKISSKPNHLLVMKLSNAGRQWLLGEGEPKSIETNASAGETDTTAGDTTAGDTTAGDTAKTLLLIADGMIIAHADLDSIRPDRITFSLAGDFAHSVFALQSALRGPVIEGELDAIR